MSILRPASVQKDTVLQDAIAGEMKDALDRLISVMTRREREIITMYYGLADGYVYSLAEIAKVFHVTRERVRQIKAKGLRRLRNNGHLGQLLDECDEESCQSRVSVQDEGLSEFVESAQCRDNKARRDRMMGNERCWAQYQKKRFTDGRRWYVRREKEGTADVAHLGWDHRGGDLGRAVVAGDMGERRA